MADRAGDEYPSAVLWDMDGTLVDSEKLWDIALYETAERLGGRLTARHRMELVGANNETTARSLLSLAGRQADATAVSEVSEWIRERTMSLFADELPFRPGAAAALTATRAAGIPCALVTSTERGLTERALDTIGRGHFDVVVCGDEVAGRNKPEPYPYQRAGELLGVSPQDCVAVEDSPPGAASAASAGCAVLVVPCDVPVEQGRRRVLRESLTGVDEAVLGDVLRAVRGRSPAGGAESDRARSG